MREIRIPVCSPEIGEREVEFVAQCVCPGWIRPQGEYVTTFEERFAKYICLKFRN